MRDKDFALGVIMPDRQSHHVVHMISEQQRVGDSNGHVDVGTHFENDKRMATEKHLPSLQTC
jgi:hypothetical protein